jgi:hypothetical protein
MKLGFDNKREVILMAVVVIAALVLMSQFLFRGDAGPTATKAKPTKAPAQKTAAASRGRGRNWDLPKDLQPSLDPSLKFDVLRASESIEYDGGKRNIFRERAEEPKIVTPPPQIVPEKVPPPPVYQPPPIPLKYYGFASKPGEQRRIFLSNGDEVFVAEEGQVIQRRYKIGKITATSVEVEDVLNNNKQTIPLTQG